MLAAERLDVVSVCVPNKFHLPLTLAALDAGCHVLCEKPMALSAAEGRQMLAAAQRAGKRLMINFSYRFSAQSRALKAQVDAGTFGDFYFGRTVWHRRRGMPGFGGWFGQKALAGGGPLIDLGVHRLDLALWLMGYPQPTWVLGSTYDPIARAAAAQVGQGLRRGRPGQPAYIRFANGASLVLEASWAANIREAELMETRLLGTQAGSAAAQPGRGLRLRRPHLLRAGRRAVRPAPAPHRRGGRVSDARLRTGHPDRHAAQQRAGVAHVDVAGHQHLLHGLAEVEQAQQVTRGAARSAHGLCGLFMRQAELVGQSFQALCFFERVEVLALDVLDQRHRRRGFVRHVLDEHRHLVQPGQFRGAHAALARDDLVAAG
jgi:predicted dehydrogenase